MPKYYSLKPEEICVVQIMNVGDPLRNVPPALRELFQYKEHALSDRLVQLRGLKHHGVHERECRPEVTDATFCTQILLSKAASMGLGREERTTLQTTFQRRTVLDKSGVPAVEEAYRDEDDELCLRALQLFTNVQFNDRGGLDSEYHPGRIIIPGDELRTFVKEASSDARLTVNIVDQIHTMLNEVEIAGYLQDAKYLPMLQQKLPELNIDVIGVALSIALMERIHAAMQVNTKRASGALVSEEEALLGFRNESMCVLGYVPMTEPQHQEIAKSRTSVHPLPVLPKVQRQIADSIKLPPQLLHVDQCGRATNLARNYISVMPLTDDSSQGLLVVPHAGALIYGIYKDLVPRREQFNAYVASCYPKLCAYYPAPPPSLPEMQTMAWGVLFERYTEAYDLPPQLTVLELRYQGFIATMSGLTVHGGNFNEETIERPVFRLHVDSTCVLKEPKLWGAPGYGSVHDLREDRDLWPLTRFIPGARMSHGVYSVCIYTLVFLMVYLYIRCCLSFLRNGMMQLYKP